MPQRIDVELETITPLFLGGANPAVPEVRAASLRGALRFWFRALAAEGDATQLRERERSVFGDTTRASLVLVEAEPLGEPHPQDWRSAMGRLPDIPRQGLNYLGFSLQPRGGQIGRQCLPAGTRLRVMLRARRGTGEDGETAVRQSYAALWLLVHLGGLGTRSRRGLGALAATSTTAAPDGLPPLAAPRGGPGDLAAFLERGLAAVRAAVPRGAFDPARPRQAAYDVLTPEHALVLVVNRAWRTWQEALGSVGSALSSFRRQQRVYPTMADLARPGAAPRPAERAAFGLPIQYYNPRTHDGFSLQPYADQRDAAPDRRASPLLLSVARLDSDRYTVVLTVLFGARFLPDTAQRVRAGQQVLPAPTNLKAVIGQFLNELASTRGLIEVQLA